MRRRVVVRNPFVLKRRTVGVVRNPFVLERRTVGVARRGAPFDLQNLERVEARVFVWRRVGAR